MNKITKTYEDHKPYALVCVHKDNPENNQVIEYFYAPDVPLDLADELNKRNIAGTKYEVMKFD
jgi:hypothetical protein